LVLCILVLLFCGFLLNNGAEIWIFKRLYISDFNSMFRWYTHMFASMQKHYYHLLVLGLLLFKWTQLQSVPVYFFHRPLLCCTHVQGSWMMYWYVLYPLVILLNHAFTYAIYLCIWFAFLKTIITVMTAKRRGKGLISWYIFVTGFIIQHNVNQLANTYAIFVILYLNSYLIKSFSLKSCYE